MNVKSLAGQLGEDERALHYRVIPPSVADRLSVSDFVALTKPRVMMLVVFTALVGLSSAPG
jgi:protoheme IX farnesyltransferase